MNDFSIKTESPFEYDKNDELQLEEEKLDVVTSNYGGVRLFNDNDVSLDKRQ